jgi:hypothetical protein
LTTQSQWKCPSRTHPPAALRSQWSDAAGAWNPSSQPPKLRPASILPKAATAIRRCAWLLVVLVGTHAPATWGQALPTASTRLDAGFIATMGGMNTQLPYYAENTFGFDFGLYLQPFSILGVEGRGGSYPISARFKQTPVTAGLRLERRDPFFNRLQPFAYFGGGFSKAQDSSNGFKPLAAIWSPCWQSSEGLDIAIGRMKWRVYEATWTETYTGRGDVPPRDLRSLSLSTGFVYLFKF